MSDVKWILGALAESIRTKCEGSIVEWADRKIKLPYSTQHPIFIADEAPWLLEPMRALCDPKIRRVDVRGPAGGAKSLIGELHIGYVIDNEPGFYYYVWQSDDDAKDAMEDRVIPLLDANEIFLSRMPADPRKKRVTKISFPHMPLYAVGANDSNAQSKRVRYLTMEEPHLYRPGMMTAFEKRCEGVKRYKILTLSTGSVQDDQSDKSFKEGSYEEWEVPCPDCGKFQLMTDDKDRLRLDKNNDTVDENGNFRWTELLKTVRYNCAECGHDWPTDEEFRKKQARLGRYRVTNTNARDDHRSFHFDALGVPWMSLKDIVQEKLKASAAAKHGSLEPLKDYIQKRKALAWDESPDHGNDFDVKRMFGGYVLRSEWPDEIARFMLIDNQHGKVSQGEGAHRWYVCRSFGATESRLIDAGKIVTWEELEELRVKLGVLPSRTLCDVAFDTQQVQSVCVKYGWQGLWGDNTNKKTFPHHELIGGQKIVRHYPFSQPQLGHVGIGFGGRAQARYFFWSKQTIRNLWHRLRDGLTLYRWTVCDDVCKEYFLHTAIEYVKKEVDKAGNKTSIWARPEKKDDHLLDCDQMSLVAALMDPRLRQILYSTPEDVPAD